MLVERIINKIIYEKINIDELLIVTFTNAAASEMREKILNAIYKKLEEDVMNEHLQKQINLLNKANICTIDAFCLNVIKDNFYEIDISPNFRIAEQAECDILKEEILEEMFESKYEEQAEDFLQLVDTYVGYRDDNNLKQIILNIYKYIQSMPYPEKWLKNKVEMFNIQNDLSKDFSNTIWGKIILEQINDEITEDIASLTNIKSELERYEELLPYSITIDNDISNFKLVQSNLSNWDKTYETCNFKFNNWPTNRKITLEQKEIAKEKRDKIKKKYTSLIQNIMSCNSYEANSDIYSMYETLRNLQNSIIEFARNFYSKEDRKKYSRF